MSSYQYTAEQKKKDDREEMKRRKAAKAAAKESIRLLHELEAAKHHAKISAKADSLQDDMEKEMAEQASQIADELARKRKKRMDEERDEQMRRQAERLRRREEHEKEVSIHPPPCGLPPLLTLLPLTSIDLPLLTPSLPFNSLPPFLPSPKNLHSLSLSLFPSYPPSFPPGNPSLLPQSMLAKLHEASIEYMDEINAQVITHPITPISSPYHLLNGHINSHTSPFNLTYPSQPTLINPPLSTHSSTHPSTHHHIDTPHQ